MLLKDFRYRDPCLSFLWDSHNQGLTEPRLFHGSSQNAYNLWLNRARRAPESPPGIDPCRIELQHLLVEFLRGLRRFREPVEIADVLPRLFDNPGAVVVLWSLV